MYEKTERKSKGFKRFNLFLLLHDNMKLLFECKIIFYHYNKELKMQESAKDFIF